MAHQRPLLLAQGGFAGVLLGLALYSFILYFAIRERVYLYYAIYVTSLVSFGIARSGFFYPYPGTNRPGWEFACQPYLGALAIIFSAMFVREFLDTGRQSPGFDRLFRAGIALVAALCGIRLAGIGIPLAWPLGLIGAAITVLYAAAGLRARLRGYRPAGFFVLAWSTLLAGTVIYGLMLLQVLPTTVVTYNSVQAGSALACILLAFALADRINLLKHEQAAQLARHTQELQEKVQQRTSELSEAIEKLQTESVTDPLTGLSNRRQVESVVQPWIAKLQRERVRRDPEVQPGHLAICLADLDNFKVINDELGHAVGDRVLRASAQLLRQNVRSTGILARWGGEEFLVLDHVALPAEEILMAERLRQAVLEDSSDIVLECGRPVSLSLGIARYPFSTTYPELFDWDACLALADHALYRAKRAGRNCWKCYRANEAALQAAVESRGEDEIQRLVRVHIDTAVEIGLVEVVEAIPTDVEAR